METHSQTPNVMDPKGMAYILYKWVNEDKKNRSVMFFTLEKDKGCVTYSGARKNLIATVASAASTDRILRIMLSKAVETTGDAVGKNPVLMRKIKKAESWARVVALSVLWVVGFLLFAHGLDTAIIQKIWVWDVLIRIAGAGILYFAYRVSCVLLDLGLLPKCLTDEQDDSPKGSDPQA